MPRQSIRNEPTTQPNAAQRAKASARRTKAKPTAVPTTPVSAPSGITRRDSQPSVALALVEGAKTLQNTHSQPGQQNLPDLNTHVPTDYAKVSGDSPELTKSEADQAIERIDQKINGQKVIQRNFQLAQDIETSRQQLAKFLQGQVKAGTAMEAVSTSVAQHQTQVENTRLENEKALQKSLEADGLQGMRELVTQEAQQKHALQAAKIARLEQKTARLLNDDVGTGEAPEALPIEF